MMQTLSLHRMDTLSPRDRLYVASSIHKDAREDDRVEWCAASGMSLIDALDATVRINTATTWVVMRGGDPRRSLMLFGVVHTSGIVGNAWLIATNEAAASAHAMHRFFVQGIQLLHAVNHRLIAWSHPANTLHHHWMLKMGFTDTKWSSPMGANEGVSFRLFIRDAA